MPGLLKRKCMAFLVDIHAAGLYLFGSIMKEILLKNGMSSLVDDDDYEKLNKSKWMCRRAGNTFYAIRSDWSNGSVKSERMHRTIISAKLGEHVDHKDGNGLNNQKGNLRICTRSQNMHNMRPHRDNGTGYKGVCRHKSGLWGARICINRKIISLKYYKTPRDAAIAYNEAAKKYCGEFALLNDLGGGK